MDMHIDHVVRIGPDSQVDAIDVERELKLRLCEIEAAGPGPTDGGIIFVGRNLLIFGQRRGEIDRLEIDDGVVLAIALKQECVIARAKRDVDHIESPGWLLASITSRWALPFPRAKHISASASFVNDANMAASADAISLPVNVSRLAGADRGRG